MLDSYELPAPGRIFSHEIEIKRSRFIAQLRRVQSEVEARAFIAEVRAQYPDARHHCSAYYFAVEAANPIERSSDDGEPSGTAGRPMLEQLKGCGMCDLAVVVTRYFGGIKLGAGGLVHAYSESVGQVLPLVTRVTRSRRELYSFTCDHASAGRLEAELRARGVHVVDVTYGSDVALTLAVPAGGREALEATLASLTQGAAELRAAGIAWVEH